MRDFLRCSFWFFLLISCIVYGGSKDEVIIRNNSLVFPGEGAEGIVLRESIDSLAKRRGVKNYSISKTMQREELFRTIFKISAPVSVPFDSLIYSKEMRFIVVNYNNQVEAIIGMDCKRNTSDAVDLNRGIEYAIYHYGNEKLLKISRGQNTFYFYPYMGLCLADDGNDGSIDMYIIFEPLK